MKRYNPKTTPHICILTCALLVFSLCSVFSKQKETRIYAKNKIYSFALPEGWMKEKKPLKNEIIIFQSEKKMPVLNPYITFSYKKLKNVPSTPPPDELWGEMVKKLIKKVDPEAIIIAEKPVVISGKPAVVSSAYVSYKKLKNHRTFQKSCQIWDGKRKILLQFILVCLETDHKTFEPVMDKLLKTVKIKG